MYYYGRDKRRRAKKRLKQGLIFLAVIGFVLLSYFFLFSTDEEGVPDTITAMDTVSNGLTVETTVDTVSNGLTADAKLPDAVQTQEKKDTVQKDSLVLTTPSDDNEKTLIPENDEKSEHGI